jgi:hypothetical protein
MGWFFLLISVAKTSRSGYGSGSGRSRIPFTIEKIAVDAPMPSANVARIAIANDGAFTYDRTAYRTSCVRLSIANMYPLRARTPGSDPGLTPL